MRGRIALQKHFVRNSWKRLSRFAAAFGVRRIACQKRRTVLCDPPPRPACGERTKVRGRLIPFSEMASVTKIIPGESRACYERRQPILSAFFGATCGTKILQATNFAVSIH